MKKLLLLVLISGLVTIISSLPANARETWGSPDTLSINPSFQNVQLGSMVSVDVWMLFENNNILPSLDGPAYSQGSTLGAFDLDVSYDSTMLSFVGYKLGSELGDVSLFEAYDFSPGLVSPGDIELAETSFVDPLSLESLQPGDFALATLTFNALKDGTSNLGLSINELGDEYGNYFSASTSPGSITVFGQTTVPEPPSWLLALLTLVELAVLSAARKKIWMA